MLYCVSLLGCLIVHYKFIKHFQLGWDTFWQDGKLVYQSDILLWCSSSSGQGESFFLESLRWLICGDYRRKISKVNQYIYIYICILCELHAIFLEPNLCEINRCWIKIIICCIYPYTYNCVVVGGGGDGDVDDDYDDIKWVHIL